MSIKGFLESYSLPELFRLLDSGHKSGKLILKTTSKSDASASNFHYLWFYKGRLVALTRSNQKKTAIATIIKNGWLSDRVIEKLVPLCPEGRPLGTYFKSIGALSEQQLSQMFEADLKIVLNLFELEKGYFEFESFSDREQSNILKQMPCQEMTGISLRGTEIALSALRKTQNWERFNHQLPDNSSGLQKLTPKSQYRLVSLEQELWKYSDSITSIKDMAKMLHNSDLAAVKRAAFRLMMAGLVEEVPQASLKPSMVQIRPMTSVAAATVASGNGNRQLDRQPTTNASLIQNFVNFLRQKL
ncbi:MAG: DUF4388 domain-containing protein [Prochloraceae cyanobacterium]